MAFVKDALAKEQSQSEELESMLLELQNEKDIQELIAALLANDTALASGLRVIARATLPKMPASWVKGIERALRHPDDTIRLEAVRAAPELAGALKLAEDARQPDEIRLAALRARRTLSTNGIAFLRQQLTNSANPLNRFAAAEILRANKLIPAAGEPEPNALERLAEYEALLQAGDPQRGRAIFFSPVTACGTCHAIGSDGGRIGPDLTKLGAIRSGRDILESILFPSSTFAQGYQPFNVTTKDGRELQGAIAREVASGLILRDVSGAETALRREQIAEMKPGNISLMPAGLERNMTRREFADLLAFLQSLK